MSHDRRALGAEGEARAARFLTRRGYRIIDRNVRAGGVEIDLVVSRGDLVVFVEVKTRRSRRFGAPIESIDGNQCARLIRGAAAWLREHPHRARRVRFDVIGCDATPDSKPGDWRLEHVEGAFEAGG